MNVSHLEQNIQRTLPGARMVETPLELCPQVKLYLLSGENMNRPFSAEEIRTISAQSPYWAFCWASGHALAYYIVQNRTRFKGKSILDFGSGSGVSAVAAAIAGAARVVACDMDPNAIESIKANAALNQVQVDTCHSFGQLSHHVDLIVAADVLYDRENHSFLETFLFSAPEVLIADSRVKTIDLRCYSKVAEITASTLPDLNEAEEFKRVRLYRGRPLRGPAT